MRQSVEHAISPPLAPAVAKEDDAGKSERECPALRVRVLIVEDNVDAADSLAMLLEVLGHEVTAVHDGFAALPAARAYRPDVMLVDIGLPGMDGYEVARGVRADPELEHVVLVALTGWEDRGQAAAAGFDRHHAKPINPPELEEILARAGAARQA